MVILYPLLPFGTPPPLGIEFAPPKMRGFLFHKGAICAFMKTPLEKSLSLALTYSSGYQYRLNVARGARRATRRAPSPCLLNFSSSLRDRSYAPRLARAGANARCASLAERRVVSSSNKCTWSSNTLRISIRGNQCTVTQVTGKAGEECVSGEEICVWARN